MCARPWLVFNRPRAERSFDHILCSFLTAGTFANTGFYVLVDVRPLDVFPGKHFHYCHFCVSLVELLQNGSTQALRNDDSVSYEHAFFLRGSDPRREANLLVTFCGFFVHIPALMNSRTCFESLLVSSVVNPCWFLQQSF